MTDLDSSTLAAAARAFRDVLHGFADQFDTLAKALDDVPGTIPVPDDPTANIEGPYAVGVPVVLVDGPGHITDDTAPVGRVVRRLVTDGELHTVRVSWPDGTQTSHRPLELEEL